MRRLTASERRLLGILAGVVFLILNLFTWKFLAARKQEITIDLAKLKSLKINADFWLADREKWTARQAWLDANQPPLGQAGALAEALKVSAEKYKIKIESQELTDANATTYYQEIAVKMKVNATLEGLTRWLAELQQPALFQVVSHLSLKSDKEKPESRVICELQISRRCALKP
jgi:hypothetical protein